MDVEKVIIWLGRIGRTLIAVAAILTAVVRGKK
jgi:hypothetical protein